MVGLSKGSLKKVFFFMAMPLRPKPTPPLKLIGSQICAVGKKTVQLMARPLGPLTPPPPLMPGTLSGDGKSAV